MYELVEKKVWMRSGQILTLSFLRDTPLGRCIIQGLPVSSPLMLHGTLWHSIYTVHRTMCRRENDHDNDHGGSDLVFPVCPPIWRKWAISRLKKEGRKLQTLHTVIWEPVWKYTQLPSVTGFLLFKQSKTHQRMCLCIPFKKNPQSGTSPWLIFCNNIYSLCRGMGNAKMTLMKSVTVLDGQDWVLFTKVYYVQGKIIYLNNLWFIRCLKDILKHETHLGQSILNKLYTHMI